MFSWKAWVVVFVLGAMMAGGGILFGMASRSLGWGLNGSFLVKWGTNPFVVAGLVLGIGSRVLSYAALRYMNVSQVALLSSLAIVLTLAMAFVFLGERFSPREIVGSALIVIGCGLVGR